MRKQLTLIFVIAIASTSSNPTYDNIFYGNYQRDYYKNPKAPTPL